MKDMQKYQGVFPAFYACYDKDGEIDSAAVRKLTAFLIQKGVKGVYVGGSSGECIYQSVPERKLVLENVMEAAQGRLTIIAHVACNNTRDSQELARHAESLGVDAIASIPPIYFRLPEHAIAKYWNDISAAAPHTDFIIYNIPQLAGVALTIPLLKEMLKNPNVIGVKNSSMPVQDIQMFKDEGTRGDRPFVVFNGPDEQFISGLMMGADGGIGGTYGAMPELFVKLYGLFRDGKWAEARQLQYDVDNIIYALCAGKCNLYAAIKEVLRRREGLDIGSVRPPLAAYTAEDDAAIAHAVSLIDLAMKRWVG